MELRKIIATTIREYLNEQETFKNTINDDNFKMWFRNSEMVKPDGTPIIFYHGTNKQFDKFDKNMINSSTDAGWLGYGFYFYTDINEARQYGKVRSFFLNIENPYYATDEDNERLAELNDIEASKEFTNDLILQGYDGVYYNGNLRGETVVFEPNQIWEIDNDVFIATSIREYLNENRYNISKDEYDNYMVYNQNDYKILVNNKISPTYITLWYFEKDKWEKVGALNVNVSERRFDNDDDFEKYYKVSEIEIKPKHRGLGFGKKMYDILIGMRGSDIKGLYSYLPDRVNKNQIPRIYKKYKSFIENDYEIINFK